MLGKYETEENYQKETNFNVFSFTKKNLEHFVDVQIESNEGLILFCHGFVLSFKSKVLFEALKLQEKTFPKILKLNYRTETLRCVLDFLYLENDETIPEISSNKVYQVRRFALEFEIAKLSELCDAFIENHKKKDFFLLLLNCESETDVEFLLNYGALNFYEIIQENNQTFLLNFYQLDSLLSHKDLQIPNEVFLLQILMNWIKTQRNAPKASLIEAILTTNISFDRLLSETDPKTIQTLSSESLFLGLEKLWIEAYQNREKLKREKWTTESISCLLPRQNKNKIQIVLEQIDAENQIKWVVNKTIHSIDWELVLELSPLKSFWKNTFFYLMGSLTASNNSSLKENYSATYFIIDLIERNNSLIKHYFCPHQKKALVQLKTLMSPLHTFCNNGIAIIECQIEKSK